MLRIAPAWLIAGAVLLRLAVYAVLAVPHGGLAEAMCQFDCGWYERIAVAGYGSDAEWPPHGSLPHWAFFPLYPLLMRLTAAVTGLPAVPMGIVLSNFCLAGFMLAGVAYLRCTRQRQAYGRFVVLVAVMPFSLFFSAPYTESLFALLATLALLGLAADRPGAGAAAAALASATRPGGILLAPVFALHALLTRRRDGWRALLPAAIAPLGLFAYIAVQWIVVGDPLAFLHVQTLWKRVWRGPHIYLWQGMAAWDWSAQPSRSLFAACGLLGLAAALWLARRRRWAEAWLLAGAVLLPAASGLDSLPRYVFCHPVFLFAAHDLLAPLAPRTAALCLAALAALGLIPLFAWLRVTGGVF